MGSDRRRRPLVALPAGAQRGAEAGDGGRETGDVGGAAPSKQVRESLVRVYDPLPEPTPASTRRPATGSSTCASAAPTGPKRARDADAVVVIIPGFLGGAGSFDQVARNTVRAAAGAGPRRRVLVARPARQLPRGRPRRRGPRRGPGTRRSPSTTTGAASRSTARRFGGFVPPEDAQFLNDFGLERTMEDWYTVLRTGIPGQRAARAQGDLRRPLARRPADRGVLELGLRRRPGDRAGRRLQAVRRARRPRHDALARRLRRRRARASPRLGDWSAASGAAPYVNAPPLTPETIQVPTVFGVGAFFDPQGTDLLARAAAHDRTSTSPSGCCSRATPPTSPPATPTSASSRSPTRSRSAGILDDNSAPLSFLRASVGQSVGGPLVDKNFPTPGGGFLALPEDPGRRCTRGSATGGRRARPRAAAQRRGRAVHVARGRGVRHAPVRAHASSRRRRTSSSSTSRPGSSSTSTRRGDERRLRADSSYDGPSLRPALLVQAGDSTTTRRPTTGRPTRARRPTTSSSAARSSSPATTTSTSPPPPGARTTAARSRPARRSPSSRST